MCNCRAAFQLFEIFEPNRRGEKTKSEMMSSDSRLISSLVTFNLLWRNFHFSPLPRIIWLSRWRAAIRDGLKLIPQSPCQCSRRWTGCAERLIQTSCIVYCPLKSCALHGPHYICCCSSHSLGGTDFSPPAYPSPRSFFTPLEKKKSLALGTDTVSQVQCKHSK